MRLLKKPNRWSCLSTAFAMAIDRSFDEVIEAIGHDGSEIIWPELEEPFKRRAFHIEELQYIALRFGVILVQFSPGFHYSPSNNPLHGSAVPITYTFEKEWEAVLKRFDGLFVGQCKGSKSDHAVAWNAKEGLIHDTSGHCAALNSFDPEYFYAAVRM